MQKWRAWTSMPGSEDAAGECGISPKGIRLSSGERRGWILKRCFLIASIHAGIAIVVLTGLFGAGCTKGPQDTAEGDTVTIEAGMDGDCANAPW